MSGIQSCSRVSALVLLLLSAAAHQARADDCAVIAAALKATASTNKPMKTFMRIGNRPERLVSIAVGGNAYTALGPDMWSKSSRSEGREDVDADMAGIKLRECVSDGTQTIEGEAVRVYHALRTNSASGLKESPLKVWIGSDGLLRQQEVRGGLMRYDYRDVQAPRT